MNNNKRQRISDEAPVNKHQTE